MSREMEELSESLVVNLSQNVVEDLDESSDEFTESRDGKRDSWVDAGSLSEELRLLDEEQKRQIEEARQWLEEEEAADEMLRRDLDELQLAGQRNHELSARLIAPEPELPPEVQERVDLLEKTVKSLQEQLNDKNVKLGLRNDSYSELLTKFNSMTERLLNTDKEFKQTLAHVKGEYLGLENVLRGKMKTYQDLNKQLELELNEREAEVISLNEKLSEYEEMKEAVTELQDKLSDTTKSVNHLNKIVVVLKGKLKSLKAERDSLVKERNEAEPVEPLKSKIVALEANIAELLEERKTFDDVELLKNRITLLEEEKGNLQLQLVDLDELKDSAESFKLLNENLKKEKLHLESVLQDVNEQNTELRNGNEIATNVSKEQEAAIAALKSALQQTTEDKIAAVMKAVEVEEALASKEKEIFYLKDSLKILEAEKVETTKQIQLRPDGDSELLSDYNVSNGLQVKLTVLEDELANSKEKERSLMITVSELQSACEDLELKLRAAIADRDSHQTALACFEETSKESEGDLSSRLSDALRDLDEHRDTISQLEEKLASALRDNEKLSKAQTEKEAPSGNSDATVQKLKKLAAMYKKRCGELEVGMNALKADLEVKQASEVNRETEDKVKLLEREIVELYLFVNEFKNIPKEHVSTLLNPSKLENVLALLAAWCRRTGTVLPSSDWVPPPISTIDNREIDNFFQIMSEKDATIRELENEKEELTEKLLACSEELSMLLELHEKESAKNSLFQTDLIALEAEMSESKSELFTRLEEATKEIQNREHYIEVLEQDIVNMKTKMLTIESGMDDRHRELKERAQKMISKLEEAEMMSSNFEKYKVEIDKQLAASIESESSLKEQLIDAQAKLEEAEEDAASTKLRNSTLEREKIDLDAKILEMQSELDTLRDVRKAYNATLDEIEVLNGGLKEAMEGFEAKNVKLDLLESERQELINKLTDLEDTFGDLEKKLEDSEKENASLKLKIESLAKTLEETQLELNETRRSMSEYEKSQTGLQLIESEVQELKGFYEDKINVLNESKEKLESLLVVKNNEVTALQNNLLQLQQEFDHNTRNYESKISELESAKHDVEANSVKRSVLSSVDSMENPFEAKDEEDGWGWTGGDNLLPSEGDSIETPESARVADLLNSIRHLRLEKDRAFEELDALKINYKKVLKKLKDLKVEKAKVENKTGFSDLEMVLQEELRKENDALQVKWSEAAKQIEVLKKERDSLTKRVDTLTSANDQLVDMKERQDIEVQMWQKRSSELSDQIQNLQWSLDETKFHGSPDELSLKYNALVNENAELQKVLNKKRDELEHAIAREQDLEKEILDLKANSSQIQKSSPSVETLTTENSELQRVLNLKMEELQSAAVREENLQKEILYLKTNLEQIQTSSVELSASKAEILNLKEMLNEKTEELEHAVARESNLAKEILDLKSNFEQIQTSSAELSTSRGEILELQKIINEKTQELERAVAREQNLQKELTDVKANLRRNENSGKSEVPSAAVLFQGTASSFDSLFPSSPNPFDLPEPPNPQLDSTPETSLETQLSLLTAKNDELSKQIDQATALLSEKDAKLQQLESQVASQKAYFDEQVQDLERNFQKALLDRDEDNAHLVCKVSAKEQALAAATQELHALREELKNVAELQSKFAECEKENFNLQSEIVGLRNYLEASKELTKDEDLKVISSLKNQISNLENAQSNLVAALDDRENQIRNLSGSLKEKVEELQLCRVKLEEYAGEIESLKSLEGDDSKVVAAMYELTSSNQDLQVTVNNQTEQLRDKDNIIVQLQTELERLNQSLAQNPPSDSTLQFLEEERLRLEALVQDRLSEVSRYEEEIRELKKAQAKPTSEDIAAYEALIAEKDAEIARLTRSGIEIQERLLLSEQGKLNPELRVVEAKLDKALYTLHARDVKIEELTVEIMQLLEERDSLQLRLSEALRNAEPSKSESPPKLHIKERLSELHAAGYKKDPLVQTEREVRHVQHMQLYAEKPPQEEQAADYGFFNWFFSPSSPAAAASVDISDNS